jgi:hypothetical protein
VHASVGQGVVGFVVQGIAPEGYPTPDTRLFQRNSGVDPISKTRDSVRTGGHPTPETRPFARVSGG